MADTGTLGTIGKLIQFFIRIIVRLTYNLALELLKFGALSLILIGTLVASVVLFLYMVRWSYVSSDGDVFYTLCVTIGMLLAVSGTFAVLQYLVKDVLKLTNMTLLEVVRLWLKPAKKDKNNSNGCVDSKDGVDSLHKEDKKEH